MRFEWDEAKRRSSLAKHDIDFRAARRLFRGLPTVEALSPHPDEERFLTTGILDDVFVTVVWTQRHGAIRIILARRARDGERGAYRELHG